VADCHPVTLRRAANDGGGSEVAKASMIPAGYLYKQVSPRGDWLGRPELPQRIYSMCPCISNYFVEYVDLWRHNGFWLFDRPEIMEDIAAERGISLSGLTCFYYEEYDLEYDTEGDRWSRVTPEESISTAVEPPTNSALQGYDIVTFSMGHSPECSPLSCNGIAAEVPVNDNCLFDSFDDAKRALESGLFRNAEPGPYRIVAVHTVDRGVPTTRE
jgi:hypothetical protein